MQYAIILFITANLFFEQQEDNRLLTVLNEVKRIDSLVSSMKKKQQVYLLTKSSDTPNKVVDRKWPKEIIETYNLLFDDLC